ncbi:MAG TPA: cyclic nucleotide-binding domain-containing protein [Acidimicrobiales bacterium]|nr:cyclic nucleotide-binding domain-containing protein [Acidimicrobiales bacterium]
MRVWEALDRALDPLAWRPQLAGHVELKDFRVRRGTDYTIIANRRDMVYYRLDPAEAAIVRRFDGDKTVGEVLGEHLDEVSELSLGEFAELMLQLQSGRMFTTGGGDVVEALGSALTKGSRLGRAVSKIVRSQPVEWRGAEGPVRWMYRHGLRFAFHPVGAVATALLAFAGFAAFLALSRSNRFSLVTDSPALEGAVLVGLSYLLGVCHEIGHAVVLVHRGCRVKSAGFLIYFGSPALFIDSSDGLMLDQRGRIQQSLAGPYTELAIAGAASLFAFAFPDVALSETLFRFALLNYFVVFLNLVPLLELDGYWIFSELIQVPDLRPRSLAFVRRQLWTRLRRRQRLTRQEVGLAVYGTLGVAFTVFSFYGAFYFWQQILGGLVSKLWGAGPIARVVLVVLGIVVAGPVVRAGIDAGRSVGAAIREQLRRVKFRLETDWRVEAAELLEESPLFHDLDADVLGTLAGRVEREIVPAGSAVFEQGDRATALYVVRHGLFAVVERDLQSGRERTLRLLGRGEVFGELALLGNAPRAATIRATFAGEVFVLPKGVFDRLLADVANAAALSTVSPGLQDLEELRTIRCFAHLSAGELAQVRDSGAWMLVPAGEVIVTEGHAGDDFYGLRTGQAEVLVGRRLVTLLGPGDWFGERALISGSARHATVRARTPARVFRLDGRAFDDLLRAAFASDRPTRRHAEQRSWEH